MQLQGNVNINAMNSMQAFSATGAPLSIGQDARAELLPNFWNTLCNNQQFGNHIHVYAVPLIDGNPEELIIARACTPFTHFDYEYDLATNTLRASSSILIEPTEHVGRRISSVGLATGTAVASRTTAGGLVDEAGHPIVEPLGGRVLTITITTYSQITFPPEIALIGRADIGFEGTLMGTVGGSNYLLRLLTGRGTMTVPGWNTGVWDITFSHRSHRLTNLPLQGQGREHTNHTISVTQINRPGLREIFWENSTGAQAVHVPTTVGNGYIGAVNLRGIMEVAYPNTNLPLVEYTNFPLRPNDIAPVIFPSHLQDTHFLITFLLSTPPLVLARIRNIRPESVISTAAALPAVHKFRLLVRTLTAVNSCNRVSPSGRIVMHDGGTHVHIAHPQDRFNFQTFRNRAALTGFVLASDDIALTPSATLIFTPDYQAFENQTGHASLNNAFFDNHSKYYYGGGLDQLLEIRGPQDDYWSQHRRNVVNYDGSPISQNVVTRRRLSPDHQWLFTFGVSDMINGNRIYRRWHLQDNKWITESIEELPWNASQHQYRAVHQGQASFGSTEITHGGAFTYDGEWFLAAGANHIRMLRLRDLGMGEEWVDATFDVLHEGVLTDAAPGVSLDRVFPSTSELEFLVRNHNDNNTAHIKKIGNEWVRVPMETEDITSVSDDLMTVGTSGALCNTHMNWQTLLIFSQPLTEVATISFQTEGITKTLNHILDFTFRLTFGEDAEVQIIPVIMTGDAAPIPFVASASAFHTGRQPWRAFNELMEVGNSWSSGAVFSMGQGSAWLQLDFGREEDIDFYEITCGNLGNVPRDWTFEVLNAIGEWDEYDEQIDQHQSFTRALQTNRYFLNNRIRGRIFRIVITRADPAINIVDIVRFRFGRDETT